MTQIPRPDLSVRPLEVRCGHSVQASPSQVYAAWTTKFDRWFAQPGTLSMQAEPGRAFFFYNRDDWGRHPHYGRFLDLRENELIEMTWLTGNGTNEGTQGAETILRIELIPNGEATDVQLTHSGFPTERSFQGHKQNWPLALGILETQLLALEF